MNAKRIGALAGAAATLTAGVVAERVAIKRRRREDSESDQDFGSRRGTRSRYLDLDDGARLFIEEVGPEVPRAAVFIHGSALRTDLWHYQMEGLGGQRLVFFDLRGHGLSKPKGDDDFTIERMARDLEAVIQELGLEEVVLVGHSVGAMIALDLCRLRPELMGSTVKGLVVLNGTYGPVFETIIGGATVARLERLARRPLDVIGKQAPTIDRLRKVVRPSDAVFWGVAFAAFGPKASASQIDFTYDMVAETESDVIFDLVRSYRKFDVAEVLGEFTVPTLVVGGTHDRLTVARASEYLAEHLPKADLHIFENCGHMSMLERHEEVNSLIERFLMDTLGRPTSKGKRR